LAKTAESAEVHTSKLPQAPQVVNNPPCQDIGLTFRKKTIRVLKVPSLQITEPATGLVKMAKDQKAVLLSKVKQPEAISPRKMAMSLMVHGLQH
jgi:hypothetical protein